MEYDIINQSFSYFQFSFAWFLIFHYNILAPIIKKKKLKTKITDLNVRLILFFTVRLV